MIRRAYNKILPILPKKYHYPIKICNNTTDIFRELQKRDSLEKTIPELIKEYSLVEYTYKAYDKIEKLYPPSANKKRKKLAIYGLAGIPILLNKYTLEDENFYFICSCILHEIGHNTKLPICYSTEEEADIFALRWMKKIRSHYDINGYLYN